MSNFKENLNSKRIPVEMNYTPVKHLLDHYTSLDEASKIAAEFLREDLEEEKLSHLEEECLSPENVFDFRINQFQRTVNLINQFGASEDEEQADKLSYQINVRLNLLLEIIKTARKECALCKVENCPTRTEKSAIKNQPITYQVYLPEHNIVIGNDEDEDLSEEKSDPIPKTIHT